MDLGLNLKNTGSNSDYTLTRINTKDILKVPYNTGAKGIKKAPCYRQDYDSSLCGILLLLSLLKPKKKTKICVN